MHKKKVTKSGLRKLHNLPKGDNGMGSIIGYIEEVL